MNTIDIVLKNDTIVQDMRTITLPFYLTSSKTKAELLSIFFLNPTKTFYLRELERRTGTSPGTLARELKAFSDDGLLTKESRGNQIYYQINPGHLLFSEIKGIVEKTSGVPVQLRKKLGHIKEVKEAYLYGSFTTGKMQAHSDIDLLLVGKETKSISRVLKCLERVFGRTINATTYSPDEFAKKQKDKSEFLYEVMKSNVIPIKP